MSMYIYINCDDARNEIIFFRGFKLNFYINHARADNNQLVCEKKNQHKHLI